MVMMDTSEPLAAAMSVIEVRGHQHKVGLAMPMNLCILCLYMGFMRLRMLTTDMLGPLAPASSAIEVRRHQHKVGLAMPIHFMFYMSK